MRCSATRAAQEPSAASPAALVARWRLGADLAVRLCSYWQISGQLGEGRRWLGKVADLVPEPAPERAGALGARGRLATLQGDLASAAADIREAIRLAVAAGHDAELADARGYLYLNLALTFTGQYAEALAAAETARQRLVACGYRIGGAGLEAQLAHLCQLTGKVDEAIERCDRGLALLGQSKSARGGGERWVSGYLYLVSGLALAQRPGRENASAKALCRALTAKHELGDVVGTAYAVEALAWLGARRAAVYGRLRARRRARPGRRGQGGRLRGRRGGGPAGRRRRRRRRSGRGRRRLPRARPADQAGAGDRGARGERAVQPRDRYAAVHLQADRRRARGAHLRQAGDLLPRPAHGAAPGPGTASARRLGLGALGDEGGDQVGDAERGVGVQDRRLGAAGGGQGAGQGLPGGAAGGQQVGRQGRVEGGDRGQVTVADRALYLLVERCGAFVQVAGGRGGAPRGAVARREQRDPRGGCRELTAEGEAGGRGLVFGDSLEHP